MSQLRPGYIDISSGQLVERKVDDQIVVNSDLTGFINVKWYGAVGDGVADDTQALQNAIDEGHKVYIPNGTYKLADKLELNSNQSIIGESKEGVTLLIPESGGEAISINGNGEQSEVNITSDVLRNEYRIPVVDTSSFSAGDLVKLRSNKLLGYVSTSGTGKARYIRELVRVKDVDGTNDELILRQPVYYEYLISDNAKVTLIDMLSDISISNITMAGDRENIDININNFGVKAYFVENLIIDNVVCRDINRSGLQVQYCYNPRISNYNVYNAGASTETTGNSTQYGITMGQLTRDGLIENCHFEDCRHCVSLGGIEGGNLNINIINSTLISTEFEDGLNTPAAADNHFGAEVKYENCYILGGARVGPLKTSFKNCVIHNGNIPFCVGIRGQSTSEKFPRELYIENCDLVHTGSTVGTDRGPIFTHVNDSVNAFKENINGCNIWFLNDNQFFSLGGDQIEFNYNTVRHQFIGTPPTPSSQSDFYHGVNMDFASQINCNNNYIEGYIRHNNTNGNLKRFSASDNVLYNTKGVGFRVRGDLSIDPILSLENNIIVNPRGPAIDLAGIKLSKISDNIIENIHNLGIDDEIGVEINNTCETIKLTNNYIKVDQESYLGGGLVTNEHFIVNDFKDLNDDFNIPAQLGSNVYRIGNINWDKGVQYSDSSYSAFSTYIETTIKSGSTNYLQLDMGNDRARISAKLHIFEERDVSSGAGSRRSASQVWHVTAMMFAGNVQHEESSKISGIGDPLQNSYLNLNSPEIGSANTQLNIPFSNSDSLDMRVSMIIELISWYQKIEDIKFIN